MSTPSVKSITKRIKSISSTLQITKAMELVATSKLKKAKETASISQPYFQAIYETMSDIASSADTASQYTSPREVKKAVFIVIAGDRGLAGGYNSNIFKLAIAEEKKLGIKPDIIAIGKKSVDFFSKKDYNIISSYVNVGGNVSHAMCRDIADNFVEGFSSGNIDLVRIFYTSFVSAIKQEELSIDVLPVPLKSTNQKSYIEYDPSPIVVFDRIIPQYSAGILHCSIEEAFTAEQAARRTAMENANKNGEEMLEKISLQYNRARQAGITQEITEIVSGSAAQGN
ncbi:MAG: ATP synthase F1 subunit gamma [Clostridiales bacterium]|nr:ATP synthase F1 subunit gamma [Clostridiales bacterium]